jgi:hypothetical protein
MTNPIKVPVPQQPRIVGWLLTVDESGALTLRLIPRAGRTIGLIEKYQPDVQTLEGEQTS